MKKYIRPKVHKIAYMKIPIPCPIEVIAADKKPFEFALNIITNKLGPGDAAPIKQVIAIEIQS